MLEATWALLIDLLWPRPRFIASHFFRRCIRRLHVLSRSATSYSNCVTKHINVVLFLPGRRSYNLLLTRFLFMTPVRQRALSRRCWITDEHVVQIVDLLFFCVCSVSLVITWGNFIRHILSPGMKSSRSVISKDHTGQKYQWVKL